LPYRKSRAKSIPDFLKRSGAALISTALSEQKKDRQRHHAPGDLYTASAWADQPASNPMKLARSPGYCD